MQEPYTLKIREIFWSVQGEGLNAGAASIFIRLSGCKLECPYCDTKDSWKQGKLMGIPEIITRVQGLEKQYPNSQIVITGGEPLEQNLLGLVQVLKEAGKFMAIETNGLYYQELPLDWWTVSPKDIKNYFIREELISRINEVKLLVNENLSVAVVSSLRAKLGEPVIFLQPQSGRKNKFDETYSLYRRCIHHGIDNIRLGLQLHRIYRID